MDALFSKDYMILWMVALTLALYLPVRQLIFALYLRRAQRHTTPDAAETRRLKRRASVTSALLCFVFSALYTSQLFQDAP